MSQRAISDGLLCDTSTFNFYTYVVAFVVLALCVVCMKCRELHKNHNKDTLRIEKEEDIQRKSIPALLKRVWYYIAIMAFCLFMFSYFTTQANHYLSSSELYPLQQGLALIFSTVMAAVCFQERVTKKGVVGIVLAFVALVFINVLPGLF